MKKVLRISGVWTTGAMFAVGLIMLVGMGESRGETITVLKYGDPGYIHPAPKHVEPLKGHTLELKGPAGSLDVLGYLWDVMPQNVLSGTGSGTGSSMVPGR